MDTIQQLEAIVPDVIEVAGRVRSDQMDDPTPCAHFTVRDLFNHMIGGASQFAPQLRGEPAPPPPAPDADLTGDDPAGTLGRALENLGAAVSTPGAFERTVSAEFGDVPGGVLARFLTVDGMVHTWDLARATGQPYDPPDALAGKVLATAQQLIAPEMRDGDTFGEEVPVPDGASNLDRLVAFAGRTP